MSLRHMIYIAATCIMLHQYVYNWKGQISYRIEKRWRDKKIWINNTLLNECQVMNAKIATIGEVRNIVSTKNIIGRVKVVDKDIDFLI